LGSELIDKYQHLPLFENREQPAVEDAMQM
jgi:hypothetical protein